jgi:hypothetical protein
VIRTHLLGSITAGFYALTPDNTTRWVALDADREDGLAHLWILLGPIQAKLARLGVPQFL